MSKLKLEIIIAGHNDVGYLKDYSEGKLKIIMIQILTFKMLK